MGEFSIYFITHFVALGILFALPNPTNPHVRSLFSLTESPAILPFVLFTSYPNTVHFWRTSIKRTSSSTLFGYRYIYLTAHLINYISVNYYIWLWISFMAKDQLSQELAVLTSGHFIDTNCIYLIIN